MTPTLALVAQLVSVLVAGPRADRAVVAAGGQVAHRYRMVEAVAAKMPPRALSRLSRRFRVYPDLPVSIADQELRDSWGLVAMGAGQAHAAGIVGAGVQVAVIDTGLDYHHQEFLGRYIGGVDCYNGDADPYDDNGHGTHVSGIIGGADNNQGNVGVAPAVTFWAVKAFDQFGNGFWSNIMCAVEWAYDHGARVMNHSYGATSTLQPVQDLFDATAAAGVLHVAAAGNEGLTTGEVTYPAKFDSVIAVSAAGQYDEFLPFSSHGPEVEVSGTGITLSAWPGNTYEIHSGTSMAAPHVTGLAALLIGEGNPDPRTTIRDSVDDLGGPGWDEFFGYGRVNAWRALGLPPPPPPPKLTLDSLRFQGTEILATVSYDGEPQGGVFVRLALLNVVTGVNIDIAGFTGNDGVAHIRAHMPPHCAYIVGLTEMFYVNVLDRLPWDSAFTAEMGCLQ